MMMIIDRHIIRPEDHHLNSNSNSRIPITPESSSQDPVQTSLVPTQQIDLTLHSIRPQLSIVRGTKKPNSFSPVVDQHPEQDPRKTKPKPNIPHRTPDQIPRAGDIHITHPVRTQYVY